MRVAPKIELTAEEHKMPLVWSRGRSTPARLVLRAKIVLAAAEGKMNRELAAELRTWRNTMSLRRSRFTTQRIAGIEKDAPRPGRNSSIPAEIVKLIVRKTMQEKPPAATRWSTRTMAKATGVSKAAVQRVYRPRSQAAFAVVSTESPPHGWTKHGAGSVSRDFAGSLRNSKRALGRQRVKGAAPADGG